MVGANARSSLWGPQSSDGRGVQVEELIQAFGLHVVNDTVQPPTYWTSWSSSFTDVTLASPEMLRFVGSWRVSTDWTSSDHKVVETFLRPPKAAAAERLISSRRFDTRQADWDRYAESLADQSRSRLEALSLDFEGDVEIMAKTFTGVIANACDAATLSKRLFRQSNPWWTRQPIRIRKTVYRIRRNAQKEREEPASHIKKLEHRSSLQKYSWAVKRAKLESRQRFVT